MARTIPITKRFEGRWCHRTRIWTPEDNMPAASRATHSSVQVEGPLTKTLGEFMLALVMHHRFIDDKMLGTLAKFTKTLKARNKRAARAADGG